MSERRDLMWDQWMKHWVDYPSQDNEGYLPERGSYKAGFLDGFKCADANPASSEGDEQDAEAYAAPWNAPVKLVIKGTFLDGSQSFRATYSGYLKIDVENAIAEAVAAERERILSPPPGEAAEKKKGGVE